MLSSSSGQFYDHNFIISQNKKHDVANHTSLNGFAQIGQSLEIDPFLMRQSRFWLIPHGFSFDFYIF